MVNSSSSALSLSSFQPFSARSGLTARSAAPLQATSFGTGASLGTRSRLEIGTFDRVFSSSGSVRRDFADVFRFNLNNRRRLRIYLGNEFSSGNNRQMTLNLLDDRTLRSVTSVRINPNRIDAITRNLNPGTYRVVVSTQSNSRGRYFLDMLRV